MSELSSESPHSRTDHIHAMVVPILSSMRIATCSSMSAAHRFPGLNIWLELLEFIVELDFRDMGIFHNFRVEIACHSGVVRIGYSDPMRAGTGAWVAISISS